jgi:hypothetical protein
LSHFLQVDLIQVKSVNIYLVFWSLSFYLDFLLDLFLICFTSVVICYACCVCFLWVLFFCSMIPLKSGRIICDCISR